MSVFVLTNLFQSTRAREAAAGASTPVKQTGLITSLSLSFSFSAILVSFPRCARLEGSPGFTKLMWRRLLGWLERKLLFKGMFFILSRRCQICYRICKINTCTFLFNLDDQIITCENRVHVQWRHVYFILRLAPIDYRLIRLTPAAGFGDTELWGLHALESPKLSSRASGRVYF